MTLHINADGRQTVSTTCYLPKELFEKARELKINRAAVIRRAMAEEIERITREEAPKIGVEEASHSTSSEANDH